MLGGKGIALLPLSDETGIGSDVASSVQLLDHDSTLFNRSWNFNTSAEQEIDNSFFIPKVEYVSIHLYEVEFEAIA